MKAAVLHKPGELVVEEVPKPTAGPNEVVLKVAQVLEAIEQSLETSQPVLL